MRTQRPADRCDPDPFFLGLDERADQRRSGLSSRTGNSSRPLGSCGLLQLAVLAPQLRRRPIGQPRRRALIHLRLADPLAQRLRTHSQPARIRGDRRPLRRIVTGIAVTWCHLISSGVVGLRAVPGGCCGGGGEARRGVAGLASGGGRQARRRRFGRPSSRGH
jgi:hypothetical protein